MTKGVALVALGLAFAAGAVYAENTGPCVQPDNGTGTVTLPPNCEYYNAEQLHMAVNGLPPDTVIIVDPIHRKFSCGTPCRTPGGPLGGEVENFNSLATFRLSVSSSSSSPLAGWTRTISVPLGVQVATGPRALGASVQSFKTDMQRLQGAITGDPDFDLFEVTGGTLNGFPSPGSTTLTRQTTTGGGFKVDSMFNVGYRIRFIGAPGGRLAGYGGATTGSASMKAATPCPASGCPCP
jgi:hypothetical protein